MGVASACRFVGSPLEQHGHNNEHANSERLGSEPNACNRKVSWTSSGSLPKLGQTSVVEFMQWVTIKTLNFKGPVNY